jgi:hypothetical protein
MQPDANQKVDWTPAFYFRTGKHASDISPKNGRYPWNSIQGQMRSRPPGRTVTRTAVTIQILRR